MTDWIKQKYIDKKFMTTQERIIEEVRKLFIFIV